jgi:hypothetical protein
MAGDGMNRSERRTMDRVNRKRIEQAKRDGKVAGRDFGAPVGAKNAYFCDECKRYTVVIHVDAGVTPMFLACRATGTVGDCTGRAHSTNYQREPWPETDKAGRPIPGAAWEWFAESETQRYGFESLSLRPRVNSEHSWTGRAGG